MSAPDGYLFDRGFPFVDPITAEHAREIYERVRRDPAAELEGDLDAGFSYVVSRSGPTVLLRAKVRPAEKDIPVSE